jgi:hypothetical protein
MALNAIAQPMITGKGCFSQEFLRMSKIFFIEVAHTVDKRL